MKKRLLKLTGVILAMAMLLTVLTACGGNAAPAANDAPAANEAPKATASADGGEKMKVAFCVNGLSHPYTMALEKFMKLEAEEQGVELTVADANMDAQKQVDYIINFVAQGYDAVIVSPCDVNNCLPAYMAAQEAGVPIIEVSGNSEGETYELVTCFVGADQEEEGRTAAMAVEKQFPDGANIVVIEGAMGSSGQIGRDKGFEDYFADKPEYVILEKQTSDWMRDKAMTVMENMLTKYDNIDVVYGHDDGICAGALEAITAAGRDGIKAFGIGASKEAVDMVKGGYFSTVDQPPEVEGRVSLQMAVKAASGESIEKRVKDPLTIVDQDNVDTFEPVF